MPMIDVYAAAGTFASKHDLAEQLAATVMRWEQVPLIALFENNTAAFVHDLEADALSNVAGGSNYVRVQVLTPATSSWAWSANSPRSSPPRPGTRRSPTGPGC